MLFLCSTLLLACDRGAGSASAGSGSAPSPADPSLLDGVKVGPIPDNVRDACATAAQVIAQVAHHAPLRRDGSFKDAFRGVDRVGCRMIVDGDASDDSSGVVAIQERLHAAHFFDDLRYDADGPDGTDVGLRRRGVLCMLSASWNGGDDSDEPDTDSAANAPTTAKHDTPATADSASVQPYSLVVDCANDEVDVTSLLLPDWTIPALQAPAFRTAYAVSPRVQSPPYVDLDFDGDDQQDIAILAEERATGKQGFVVLNRNAGIAPLFIAAGHAVLGCSDDLAWISDMDVLAHNTMNAGESIAPPPDIAGDGIIVHDATGSRKGLLYWNGTAVACAMAPPTTTE